MLASWPQNFQISQASNIVVSILLRSISSIAHLLREDWCANYKGNTALKTIYTAQNYFIVILLSFIVILIIDHCYSFASLCWIIRLLKAAK